MKYEIKSSSSAKFYTVEAHDHGKWWSCNCPHWVYRMRPIKGRCKHIDAVIKHNKLQEVLQADIARQFESGSGIDWLEQPVKLDDEDDDVSMAPAS